MRVALGFDTSCYTTSVAAVDRRGEVMAFSRMLLPVGEGQRGLRQSEAVFAHVRQMPLVMNQLRAQLPPEAEIVAVCCSDRPRDGEDSYMPVFTVGAGHAQVVADALRVPLYRTTHQRGHIAAGLIGNPAMPPEYVALHISGGTTELLSVQGEGLTLLGGSLDLHAGQLVDRVGVALGLPFPAGPGLEKLATACKTATEGLLPAAMEQNDLYCHLSGGETKAQEWIRQGAYPPERIAAELYDLLARTVARLLTAGCQRAQTRQSLLVGGVASSGLLRELVLKRLQKAGSSVNVAFGDQRYSADNAAGVAVIGMGHYLTDVQAQTDEKKEAAGL